MAGTTFYEYVGPDTAAGLRRGMRVGLIKTATSTTSVISAVGKQHTVKNIHLVEERRRRRRR